MDRLVIRPAPWVLLALGLTVGIAGAAAALAGLGILLHGQAAGLIFLAFGASCLTLLYVMVGGTLEADREWVRNTRLTERGSCRRDELAFLRIVPTGTRSGPACAFVRKDGSVAFRTVFRVWGNDQLTILARFLGVPLVHTNHPATHVCPVCGYSQLVEPPYSNNVGSREICPSCGFEFSGAPDPAGHEVWRQQWVAEGMPWWAAQGGRPAPDHWDAAGQLKALLGSRAPGI